MLDQTHSSIPLCWSLTPLSCFQLSATCWLIKHTRAHSFPDGLVEKHRSVVCFVCYLCSSSIRFCRGLHNAATGTWRSVAAVLCSSMRVCNEEGVLPQDRGGFLELRAEWNEHHSEQDAAGRRVSTSRMLSLLLRSLTAGAHPIMQHLTRKRKERPHFFCVGLPSYLQCADFCFKSSDRPQKSQIFCIPPLAKTDVEDEDS